MKACSRCKVEKPATTDFYTKKLDKLSSECKACRKESRRNMHPEEVARNNEIARNRRKNNGDAIREADRARYAANPDAKRESVYRWREANPERVVEINAKHYVNHTDKKKQLAKEWALRNPDRRTQIMRNLHKRRMDSDPKYRINRAVRSYVYFYLKRGKGGKRTQELLGYSIDELMSHLERQFVNGMSWDNYGTWHIDHIVPVASFSTFTPESDDFRRCWALSNLRPLWGVENIKKRDKRLFLI